MLVADERTNSVLLGGDRTSRLRLRAIISHLDTPLERGGNTKVIYLKYAKAVDLVEVLTGVGESQAEEIKGKPAAAASARDKRLDIQADEATNSLVITAPPALMRSLEIVIRQLDIRRSQVLVDAVIAEIGEGRARELGVQWAVFDLSGKTAPVGGTNFTNTGTSLVDIANGILDGAIPGVTPGMSFGVGKLGNDGVNFAAVVNALAGDSDVNILSTPSLVTLDNEEAEIIVGQNVPFVTGSFTSTGAAQGSVNPFQTVQREDVGITLKVKPQINEGNSIIMEITQEVSTISDDAQAVDIITNKRNIKTNVLVDDNHVVVLGGLIEDQVRESEQKVPLLGDIPYLGVLFRSKSVNRRKVNLMVFLHPVILRDNATADSYTADKYNYIRALQLEKDTEGVPLMSGKGAPHISDMREMLELPPPFEQTPAAQATGNATGLDEDE
jgi:general secretion pathway protein D